MCVCVCVCLLHLVVDVSCWCAKHWCLPLLVAPTSFFSFSGPSTLKEKAEGLSGTSFSALCELTCMPDRCGHARDFFVCFLILPHSSSFICCLVFILFQSELRILICNQGKFSYSSKRALLNKLHSLCLIIFMLFSTITHEMH